MRKSILVLIIVLIASIGSISPALAMYGTNTPSKFCTDRGSYYHVTATNVLREKASDNTTHSGPKNIYFASTGGRQKDALREIENGKQVDGVVEKYKLNKHPSRTYWPLDMYLTSRGYIDRDTHGGGAHMGHEINYVGNNADKDYCNRLSR
ncbi:MAG: hypothetical protein EBE86_030955 [Hormoscilla sp. GUM202]|nr:hypothetical protein [Hormoscilla sp. GUM202]